MAAYLYLKMSNRKTIGELSEITTHRYFQWKIHKFSSSLEMGNIIPYKSQPFILMNVSSHLGVQLPNHTFDYVTVSLNKEKKYPCDITVSFSIKMLDGTLFGTKTVVVNCNDFYSPVNFEFLDRSTLQREKSELLPDGTLTIFCDFEFDMDWKERLSSAAEANTLKVVPEHVRLTGLDKLSENFKNLLGDKESCDVTLKVQGRDYKAHRCVLMARSSVFDATFKHDTLERQTGIITISDCDPDSFEIFLEYLYCGKLAKLSWRDALNLYYSSNKYDIEELRPFCIESLKHSLTVESVCEVAVFADKYSHTQLSSAVQDFFNKNFCNISVTSEWEDLMKNEFRLGNELLRKMSSKSKLTE